MKFERISEDKLRVTLSAEYLRKREIEIKTMRPNSRQYQELLRDVLDRASVEMGGNGLGKRIIVDGCGDKDGNWIITITKVNKFGPNDAPPRPMPRLSKDEPVDDLMDALMSLPDEDYAELTREIPNSKFEGFVIFSFRDFESLLGACSHCPNPKIMPSQLFLYKNEYYLVIKISDKNYTDSVIFESACNEYHGKMFYGREIMSTLLEYGKPLIKRGAIPTLLRKFEV